MDPRRARDPRLARADPRQRPHSGSPFNALPPQQAGQYVLPYSANGISPYPQQGPSAPNSAIAGPSYSAAPPQAHPPQQYSSSPASNQQLKEEAQGADSIPPALFTPRTNSQQLQQSTAQSNIYRAKPLFCVVCASNQVCRRVS